jgi:hypothetical protein
MRLDTIEELNHERDKRKQRRNHLNNIDEMVENTDIPREPSLRSRKATSYCTTRTDQRSKSVVKNNFDNERMRSISPTCHMLRQTKAIHRTIADKISDHNDMFQNQKMKVFELTKSSSYRDKSSDSRNPHNSSTISEYEVSRLNQEKYNTRMRNLRYKNIPQANNADFYTITNSPKDKAESAHTLRNERSLSKVSELR